MTISQIQTIVEQGRTAFADGKKLEHNPYVNNPEFHMHWMNGFHQAAMEGAAAPEAKAEVKAEEQMQQVQQVQQEAETTAKEETPVEEVKPTKSSSKAKE